MAYVKEGMEVFGQKEFDHKTELDELYRLSERIRKEDMLCDSLDFVHEYLNDPKKRIIAEGANATHLDLDFGTYPFVTSSCTHIGGVCTGLGVPPSALESNIGIVKAYTTRVGAGPFPTEQENEVGEHIQQVGHEYGATTGRLRRAGWLDLNMVKFTHKINGLTSINITKLDVLTGLEKLKICTKYELDGKVLEGSMPA